MHPLRRSLIVFLFAIGLYPSANHADGAFTLSGDLFVGVYDALRLTWEKTVTGCVWSDAGETIYYVTIDGLHDTTTYHLENDVGDQVTYDVFWSELASTGSRDELTPGVKSVNTYPVDGDTDCDDVPNLYLSVVVNKAGPKSIDGAPAGIYTDSLLITIEPE